MLTIKGDSWKKWDSYFFWEWDSYFLVGTPTFYKKGVPDSYFKNPSENPVNPKINVLYKP